MSEDQEAHIPEIDWIAGAIEETIEERLLKGGKEKAEHEAGDLNIDLHCAPSTFWMSMYPGEVMPRTDMIRGHRILAYAHSTFNKDTDLKELAAELHAQLTASAVTP